MKILYPEVWEAFTCTFYNPAHYALRLLLLSDTGQLTNPGCIWGPIHYWHHSDILPVARLMDSPGAVPPSLPPSVEEAYRRKCVQLKQRMTEVEEANDASRQRIVRMERSIQKMRLERAFLLEQLSKRTSTNVEDSEGSPSPPPTVRPAYVP